MKTIEITELRSERLILIPYTVTLCENFLNNNFNDLDILKLKRGEGWPDADVLETLPRIINNLSRVEGPTGFESWMIIKKIQERLLVILVLKVLMRKPIAVT